MENHTAPTRLNWPAATDYGPGKTALVNVRVFDGQRLRAPSTVVIDGERIGTGTDTSGARVVDGRGGVLLPGLIDAHIHLNGLDTLEQLTDHGVTTALDMGTWPASTVTALRGRAGLTDIRSSGIGASSAVSVHGQRPGRPPEGVVAGPGDVSGYVADRVAEGADYVKVIIDLPGFDQPTLNALVAAAHEQGRLAVAHAASFEAVAMAQAAGVDAVTHVPLDRPLDGAAAALMLAEGRVVIPTLTMMEGIAANARRPRHSAGDGPSYSAARESVGLLYRAGVPVLAGTDANKALGVPASPEFGDSLHRELELLVDAGLSTVDALRAATVLPARHFGLTARGTIEAGMRADLVLIAGDPVADITATRRIAQVWCAGVERFED